MCFCHYLTFCRIPGPIFRKVAIRFGWMNDPYSTLDNVSEDLNEEPERSIYERTED